MIQLPAWKLFPPKFLWRLILHSTHECINFISLVCVRILNSSPYDYWQTWKKNSCIPWWPGMTLCPFTSHLPQWEDKPRSRLGNKGALAWVYMGLYDSDEKQQPQQPLPWSSLWVRCLKFATWPRSFNDLSGHGHGSQVGGIYREIFCHLVCSDQLIVWQHCDIWDMATRTALLSRLGIRERFTYIYWG